MKGKKKKKEFEKKIFSSKLLKWYYQNKRNLPWRNQNNPYKIWVSEIILQQTRVEQGRPYYLKFIKTYPDVVSLANASRDEVLKIWEGLGYYRRALHMKEAAHQVVCQFKGVFPSEFEQIIKLKGVGEYTAAAIASIAFNEPRAVVDGNVVRVISRLFCIREDVSKTRVKNKIKLTAKAILNTKHPGDFNQAMMELGAMVCVPHSPKCKECPVSEFCSAYKLGVEKKLPRKKSKIKAKERYFLFYFVEKNNKIALVQRQNDDIWKGLYELPSREFKTGNEFFKKIQSLKSNGHEVAGPLKHVLSHQIIHACITNMNNTPANQPGKVLVELTKLNNYPKPVLISKLLNLLYEIK